MFLVTVNTVTGWSASLTQSRLDFSVAPEAKHSAATDDRRVFNGLSSSNEYKHKVHSEEFSDFNQTQQRFCWIDGQEEENET